MKILEKTKLIFSNVKCIKKIKSLEKILSDKDNLIESLRQELEEYRVYTETNSLIERNKDLEHLIEVKNKQKREFRAEISDLKEEIIRLKTENLKYKN